MIHIEAGLRTNDIYSPWPEEANRKLVSGISDLNFAQQKLLLRILPMRIFQKKKCLFVGTQ